MKRYGFLPIENLRRYPIAARKSKVESGLLARPYTRGESFPSFLDSLPHVLGAHDLKAVARAIAHARREGRPVVLGIGAHVIKVGLSPIIIDLMERGLVTALATNGACIVHDFELSYAGQTSEDVAEALGNGSFGMALETGERLNMAIKSGVARGLGIGGSVGEFIRDSGYANAHLSLFAACARLDLPATVHVAIGTDIIHMHPEADGAAIGEGSLRDFKLFSSVVADLAGGVYVNLGSAVILPEVFLKALSVARNLGHTVDRLTTVNMDFIQHYRPRENVLRRPTLGAGASYALTGHHEIMFPLLAAAIVEEVGA